jgi:hypothetical protein
MTLGWRAWLLTALLIGGGAAPAEAQVFLASRPHPDFAIGPLFIRATVAPDLGPVLIDVLWSLEIPATRSALELEQDLYLIWPGEVSGLTTPGDPDRALARYVEQRGFTALSEGRLPLYARSLYQMGHHQPPEPVGGGAPFVTFVQTGTALGLTSPASFIRIPWTPRVANRAWLMDLQMRIGGLIKPRKANWIEDAFWGKRHLFGLTYHDVRPRAVFPLYFEHRDRVIRLGEAPAELIVNFADADHLKIVEVFPASSRRQLSESLESTEVVSFFLDKSQGTTAQQLTVQFGYFSGLQALAPVVIPLVFFILGNLAGPLLRQLARSAARGVAARVQLGRPREHPRSRRTGVVLGRDLLAQIVPEQTRYDDVLRLCGPDPERHERLATPGRETLVYRGRRIVPQRNRTFGWLTTVSRWEIEDHTTEIELEDGMVRDVQAHVRRTRLSGPEAPAS